MRFRHSVLAGLGLIVAAIAAGAFYLPNRSLSVPVAAPERDIAIQVYGLGTVEARVLSKAGFKVAGLLTELHADHGDRVAAGTVLARLDAREQEARLARARAGVAVAEANARQTAARLERARAVHVQRVQVNKRRQELVRRGNVSVESAEEAATDVQVATADIAVSEAEAAVARAALDDARAQLRIEQALADQHVMTAPYDAVVVQRLKELGTVLAPGEPLFTLIDPATVWTRAFIDEQRAGGLAVGQPAELRLRSLPTQAFRGRIARIDIESDRVSEERRVHVACDTCPPEVYLGEQAEVVITKGRLAEAVLVPETAVEGFDGAGGTVWTVEDGRLAQRQVRFADRTLDGRLVIASPLPAGARVVTALEPGLRFGRRAEVREGAP